jgi:hypothetical protein
MLVFLEKITNFVQKTENMYLAPLNYDRFFKKVFSDIKIAKRFLEDFLDKTIESIEALPNKHKITDDATAVEFDFRCKIDGQFIIVDMQQWFKTDVVKRFYLYHSLNTALQIKDLPNKSFDIGVDDKTKQTPDYHYLEPVLTLIWMADDTLGFTEDVVSYVLTPEILAEFIRDDAKWDKVESLKEERAALLALLNNKTKEINFLGQNKLIYALQKNIVKNKKIEKYVQWFEFAEKTKKKDNSKDDFQNYEKDEVFREIIKRLNKEELKTEDFQYIEDYELFQKHFLQHEKSIWDSAYKEGKNMGIDEGDYIRREKTAENCLLNGMSREVTAKIAELPIEVVAKLAQKLGL